MNLHTATWPEVEAYLTEKTAIIIPIGSTEQHGPTGLMGTDVICAELIANEAGKSAQVMVGPTFNVGMAQHHMAFPGSMTLRPTTMIAAVRDWITSLTKHGFTHFYFLNGHGGNVATLEAAFSEIYTERSMSSATANAPVLKCAQRNWWELPTVRKLRKDLYGAREGSHATPSEVAVTYFAHPDRATTAELDPAVAPNGSFTDAHHFRRSFPDGRMGSDPSLATVEQGQRLVEAAAADVAREVGLFIKKPRA